MPKTKRRKKSPSRASAGSAPTRGSVERTVPAGRAQLARKPSVQNAVFSTMVALGCLGMAAFFTFFYPEDANHYLYGGVMAVTAVGWLVIATRRWSVYRRRA